MRLLLVAGFVFGDNQPTGLSLISQRITTTGLLSAKERRELEELEEIENLVIMLKAEIATGLSASQE